MKLKLALCFICLVYLCSCTGLSFGKGSDIVGNGSYEWNTSQLNKVPGTTNTTLEPIGVPLNLSSNLSEGNLSINGTKFNDLNGDGLRAKDDPGLPDWTIMLMRDGKEILQTITDDEGRYSFKNLTPGMYTVAEKIVEGWNQTCPREGNYEINLVDKDAYDYDFGNHYVSFQTTLVPRKYPIMPPYVWQKHAEEIKSAPKAPILPELESKVQYTGSLTLLNYVPYSPKERDQGYCGNCWVWGCTAVTEIANSIQNGIFNRLSIQYLNSNYHGPYGWACCGGWEQAYASFYNSAGKFIPWSNANANWRDGNRQCSDSSSVAASTISTNPNYPITSIQFQAINTHGVGQNQAIANIKNILAQKKGVTFAFYLPSDAAWNSFVNFWLSSSGNWDPTPYCGLSSSAGAGGHLVTCVGYDDTTDSWIMLNSWGVSSARPDGTFRVKMHMNYDCQNNGFYSYDFGTFSITFGSVNTPPNTPSVPTGSTSGTAGSSYSYSTRATDPNGDQVKYTFNWGDGTTSTTTLVNSGMTASASHRWSTARTYQIKAMAKDSKGATSGWSNSLAVSITGHRAHGHLMSGIRQEHIRSKSKLQIVRVRPRNGRILGV